MILNPMKPANVNTLMLVVLVSILCIGPYLWCNSYQKTQHGSVETLSTLSVGVGGYPRMASVNGELLLAYSAGDTIIVGIDPIAGSIHFSEMIIPGAGRSTLAYHAGLHQVFCTFNYGGMEAGAAIGIAYANDTAYENASDWVIQWGILGPVAQSNHLIGIWEPFLYPLESSFGDFLLFFSNQTVFDEANPIDDNGYYFEESETGDRVNQAIAVYWLKWNGTAYEADFAGNLSEDIEGVSEMEKDGMASVVATGENEYLATFETFPIGKPATIKAVKFQITGDGKIQSLARLSITDDDATAPFVVKYGDGFVVSYHSAQDGAPIPGLIGISSDLRISNFIHCLDLPPWWMSVCTDANGDLWHAGGMNGTNEVVLTKIRYTPYYYSNLPTYVIIAIGFCFIPIILIIRRKQLSQNHQ